MLKTLLLLIITAMLSRQIKILNFENFGMLVMMKIILFSNLIPMQVEVVQPCKLIWMGIDQQRLKLLFLKVKK